MITWLFDRKNSHGFLPNLIKDENLKPNTNDWWNLAIQSPYSLDFTFLKYCKLDNVPVNCVLANDYLTKTNSAYYPINLNFWDPDIDYIQLMDTYSRNRFKNGDFKVLFYYTEGDNPNPEIYNSLDRMQQKHGYDKDNIRFAIGNYKLKNEHPFIYFPDMELYYRYLQVIENKFVKKQNIHKPRDKKFTCLIRADKIWRKIFASYLYQLDLLQHGYFSYTNYKYDTSVSGVNDIDSWLNYDETLYENIASFSLRLPYRCDDLSDSEHNNHKLVNHNFYTNSYFNFVVETLFSNDTIVLSEKTFKPILNLQPFVLIGNPGSLQLLRDLGYRTFEEVIKQDYDKVIDHKDRMSSVLKVCYDLCKLSHQHHLRIQDIIKDIVAYNQRHFLKPKVDRINKFLNALEYV